LGCRALKVAAGDAAQSFSDRFRFSKIDTMLSYFSHLNAKLLSTPQRYNNCGMLAVDLRRMAPEGASHCQDLFVDYSAAFTGFHQEAPDGE
jgi:hypothetical protein